METKRILICDDHKILRDGLTRILNEFDSTLIIDEAAGGKECIQQLELNSYDLLILDLSLPDIDGMEVLRTVKTNWPQTNVLMLSMRSEEQYAVRCLQEGAAGYLNKEVASEEMLLAIKTILDNRIYIGQLQVPLLAKHIDKTQIGQSHEMLSGREFQVFVKLAEGKTIQDIAKEIFISAKTVSTYKARVMQKMNLKTAPELTRYCGDKGLI